MASLFNDPDAHAANPPESWTVVECELGFYELHTKDGRVLNAAMRPRERCERLKTEGIFFDLYERERKWFAGAPMSETHWPPYTP